MKRGRFSMHQPKVLVASVMKPLDPVAGFGRRVPLSRGAIPVFAALCLLGASGCGGGFDEPPLPPPPATMTLAVTGGVSVEEAENPLVTVTVELDAPASSSIGVRLHFAGTADRGRDYEVPVDGFTIPVNAASATAEIDVYRDFDEEGDETIEVAIGAFTGNARVGDPSSVTLTVLDGEAATVDKTPPDEEESVAVLLPLLYGVAEDAVVLLVLALVPGDAPVPLVAEWSTDIAFDADVHTIGAYEIVPSDDPFDFFLNSFRQFRLPLAELAPKGHYFIRTYLGEPPPSTELGAGHSNVFLNGFATNAEGRVAVECEAPDRTPDAGGGDPLFAEQWHLRNTGQTAFSDRAGTAGADLGMATAIEIGQNGAGVKLGVVDTGIEICHPDLAANTRAGGSFNFAFPARPGSSRADPFNFSTIGDHGTSVAGVAAAAANNGHGGRGVAPEVTLVGFNPLEATGGEGDDPEAGAQTAMLLSLGGSDRDPDSASVDIFNMSFGYFAPSGNSPEEFVRLFAMGTEQLRSGRGALYIKAAGNAFICDQTHPFNLEVGCVNSNADPDQNLPWLIVVGGFNADDVKSSYSSAGANLWVVGPSGEDGIEAPAMITTDQAGALAGFSQFPQNRLTSAHPLNRDGDYVSAFGGTSSAAPAVAGAVAILLGVNPELTWRDVKHILATTARTIHPDISEVRAAFDGTPYIAQRAWQTNAAGYDFHNWYGFGAVDVDAAVAMAADYAADGLGTFVESEWFDAVTEAEMPLAIPDADGAGASAVFEIAGLPDTANIEAVVLEIAVEHTNAFDLGVTLQSPAGTANVVNPPLNAVLEGFDGLKDWRLLSNAFYSENPNGTWTLHVADLAAIDTGSVTGWRLRFYYGEHPAD